MPILAGLAPVALGAIQYAEGKHNAKEAQTALENIKTPPPNQSIIDYYNSALQRYNTSPYQSALYKNAQNTIDRHIASVIGSGENPHSVGAIPNIVQAANDASLKAGATAENQQKQDFATLGRATQMKAQTEQRAQDAAFNKEYGILGLKASGGNKDISAGINNIWGGLSSAAQIYGSNKSVGKDIWGNPINNNSNGSNSVDFPPGVLR